MEFLRFQIRRIQEQLAGLAPSQRMLAGALVVIMVMTLYWWTTYANRSELISVIEQGLSAENITTISSRLRALGVDYQINGDRIMVPAERRDEVFADLAYSQLLPEDTRNGFDELISRISPFQSSSMTDTMTNEYRQSTLASIIRRFPRISHAMVMIDPKRERGPNGVEPSATISITMRSGASPDSKLVNAAADLVAGAVANLKRSRIRVIIDGVSYPVRDRDDLYGGGDEYLAQVQKAERYYVEKVANQLAFIEGAMVSVTVKPNIERRETIDHKVDPKNFIQKAVSEQTTTEENIATQSAGGEPGVVSNTGMSLGEAAAPDTTSGTSETMKTDYVVDLARSDVKTWNPGGDLAVTACSVLVPRSHFLKVYKQRTNVEQDPDATVLDPFITSELQRLRPGVRLSLGLASDDLVHVDAYTDLMQAATAAVPQAAATSISLSMSDHVKEIALGALALMSLLMVVNMVKKGTPAPVVPPPAAPRLPPQLPSAEEAVGEAAEGAGMLDGMEVDEDSVRATQMLSQVSQLVDENPDAAAKLIKRWLHRA